MLAQFAIDDDANALRAEKRSIDVMLNREVPSKRLMLDLNVSVEDDV